MAAKVVSPPSAIIFFHFYLVGGNMAPSLSGGDPSGSVFLKSMWTTDRTRSLNDGVLIRFRSRFRSE